MFQARFPSWYFAKSLYAGNRNILMRNRGNSVIFEDQKVSGTLSFLVLCQELVSRKSEDVDEKTEEIM